MSVFVILSHLQSCDFVGYSTVMCVCAEKMQGEMHWCACRYV